MSEESDAVCGDTQAAAQVETKEKEKETEHTCQSHVCADENPSTSNVETRKLSTARLASFLAILWIGALLTALDSTMLATITIPIASGFGDFGRVSWVATTYMIGSSISQPVSGHLTDMFGRRKGLLIAQGLFVTGTLICGLSHYARALSMFLAGRIVQGLGGGSILSIVSFIETDLLPLKSRAVTEGLGNVAYGCFNSLGGYYGGSVTDAIGWQWAFLVQVPVMVVNIVITLIWLRLPTTPPQVECQRPASTFAEASKSVDWTGCFLMLLTIIFLQLALNDGNYSKWDDPLVVSSFTIAGVSFGCLVYWDTYRAAYPVLPFRHLWTRTIAASGLASFFNSMSQSAMIFYIPIYLQIVARRTPGESGLFFVPYAAALGIASSSAGFIVKKLGTYYKLNLGFQAMSLAGAVCVCTMSERKIWSVYLYLTILGAGYGGTLVTRLMGLLSSAEQDKLAAIQAASWTLISTGESIGIALAASIFRHLYVGPVTAVVQDPADLLSLLNGDYGVLTNFSESLRQEVVAIYGRAAQGTFYMALAAAILSAVSSFFMENNRV